MKVDHAADALKEAQSQTRHSSAPPASTPRIKGVAFRTVVQGFAELHGQALHEQCLALCSTELREALTYHRIVPSGWYPIEWYRQLLSSFCTVTGGEDCLRELGRKSIEVDIRSVYRALVKMLKPETILAVFTRLFSNYYSHGKLVVEERSTGYMRMRLSDCVGFDRHMYLEIISSAERLLELAGGKNVRVRLLKGGRDAEGYAVVEGRWT